MARRRTTRGRTARSRRALRLQPFERLLFIVSALVYLVGLFGGIGVVAMPLGTAIAMLAIGGGIQIGVSLSLLVLS
jgi:cytochrome c oxidase subunit IV